MYNKVKYYVKLYYMGKLSVNLKPELIEGVNEFETLQLAYKFYQHVIETTENLMSIHQEKYQPYEKILLMKGGRLLQIWRKSLAEFYYSHTI